MGNIWTEVYESKSPTLKKHVHSVSNCDKAIKETKNMIQEVIDIVNSTKKWERTNDFKRYKLYPGQEVFYRNILGNYDNIHPGIYLYDGLVLEVGSGPRSCKGTTGFATSFFGLNTLKEFKYCGKHKRKSPIWKVVTGKDHEKRVILLRLRRAKRTVGNFPFRIFSQNCTQITHKVAFGQPTIPKDSCFVQISKK